MYTCRNIHRSVHPLYNDWRFNTMSLYLENSWKVLAKHPHRALHTRQLYIYEDEDSMHIEPNFEHCSNFQNLNYLNVTIWKNYEFLEIVGGKIHTICMYTLSAFSLDSNFLPTWVFWHDTSSVKVTRYRFSRFLSKESVQIHLDNLRFSGKFDQTAAEKQNFANALGNCQKLKSLMILSNPYTRADVEQLYNQMWGRPLSIFIAYRFCEIFIFQISHYFCRTIFNCSFVNW